MDDKAIVDLYWARSEAAISETAAKYGGYCYSIAYNVLNNSEDAEESVNDTYLTAWNKLPPHRPNILSAFLSKLTRCIAIDRWRSSRTLRRGGGEMVLALDELGECVAGSADAESAYLRREAAEAFNRLLDALPETERNVFLRRYFCLDSVSQIASSFAFSESKVKSMLMRTRGKLRRSLEKEDLI